MPPAYEDEYMDMDDTAPMLQQLLILPPSLYPAMPPAYEDEDVDVADTAPVL